MTLAGRDATSPPSLKRVAEGLGISLAVGEPRRRRPRQARRSSTRTEDPSDRRLRLLTLTEDGQAARRPDHGRPARGAGAVRRLARRRAARSARAGARAAARARGDRRRSTAVPKGGRPMTRYRHLITDDNAKWWTLGAMCFALFMIMLDNTVVNVALPSIQKDLGAEPLEPRVGRQRLHAQLRRPAGHRRAPRRHLRPPPDVPRSGSTIFALSSATAGLAQDTTMLVVSRVVQGVGGGADDARDALDRHQRLRAARARQGDRHLGRSLGARARDRARASAGCSPSTSPGARSSTSTSRSRSAPSPRRSSPCASRATRPSVARSTTSASAR